MNNTYSTKLNGIMGAATFLAATALLTPAAVADWSPIASGGVERVVSYSLANNGQLTFDVTHTFTNAGEAATFTLRQDATVDVLVVAGGGGGGNAGGGGGGGGVIYKQNLAVTAGDYVVNVGTGGVASVQGGNSSVFGLEAIGGGKGGNVNNPGGNGGSGGGGGMGNGASWVLNKSVSGGSGTTMADGYVQGYVGGVSTNKNTANSHNNTAAGGGGGAGGPGYDATIPETDVAGNGGQGMLCTIAGTEEYYGGGGGGGVAQLYSAGGTGGIGGGGNGGRYTQTGSPGMPNTGGGGGGGGKNLNTSYSGGAGGSGIVIIRYTATTKNGFDDAVSGDSCKKVDGDFVHTYTEAGVTNTFTVPSPTLFEILVVAGGGGGGTGGGGAGGLIHTNLFLMPGDYSLCVGSGGSGGTLGGTGADGMESFFGDLVAVGGGGGGGRNVAGMSGGSGGGGGAPHLNAANPTPPAGKGTLGQGNPGGAGSQHKSGDEYPCLGGGGGGAGGAGIDARAEENAGNGGDGLAFAISGQSVFYAAGGGGGGNSSTDHRGFGGSNGIGGTGAHGIGNGGNAVANTGSGGGGSGQVWNNTSDTDQTTKTGGLGADGIVILRHAKAPGADATVLCFR